MLISESQLKNIINEEIQKMINEGEIHEAFLDTLRGKAAEFGSTASRLAGLSGSKTKTATAADQNKITAQKEKAKQQVLQKIQKITAELSKMQTQDVAELERLAAPLTYSNDSPISLDYFKNAIENVYMRLDTIAGDISGERIVRSRDQDRKYAEPRLKLEPAKLAEDELEESEE